MKLSASLTLGLRSPTLVLSELTSTVPSGPMRGRDPDPLHDGQVIDLGPSSVCHSMLPL